MKKINQYLLTHYPLIWNLKLIYVLPLALFIHICFYLGGRLSPIGITDLKTSRLLNIEESIGFSILITTVLVILWLVFYLRNNPFKSYYPLKKGRLFTEFILVILVFFSSAAFFLTYQQGKYDAVENLTDDIALVDEVNLSNQALMFIPFSWDDYKIYNSCDSQEVREARKLAYEKDRKKQIDEAFEEGIHISLPTFYDITNQKDEVDTNRESYLYYCTTAISFWHSSISENLDDRREISDRGKSWLLQGHKDSVLLCLTQFESLLKKYEIPRRISMEGQIPLIFSDRFLVSELADRYDESHWEDDVKVYHTYLDKSDLEQVFQNITNARDGFWTHEMLLVLLYYAIGAAIVLFSFRLVKLRLWFIALVSLGVLSIIYALMMVLVHEEEFAIYMYLGIFLIVSVLTIGWIRDRIFKSFSAVGLLWIIWNISVLIPMLYAMVSTWFDYNRMEGVDYYDTMDYWLEQHAVHMAWLNLPFVLLMVAFVLIPLARKWHANPEE